MCGIVGAITFSNNFRVSEPYLINMRDTMIHRGPDGAGVWVDPSGKVGLAHRRLSIIDLSSSATQPMANDDNSVVLSFNGEIYNHAAIRQELNTRRKIRWKTDHSDTEVIIRAYEEWGIDCLDKFRGMFAIALWDKQKKCLWLARDRIGIKPLYYSHHHGRVTFASEIKALLQDPDQRRELDEDALASYMSFICTPAPKTLFGGVRKLEAGTWLRINEDGNIHGARWYDVLDHTNAALAPSGDALYESVLNSLAEVVELHKEGDVPMGVFLSGGVDSSANTALFSRGQKSPVNTFSIGYDADYKTYTNELAYAREMARSVGANHHELVLNEKDLMDFIPQMIHLQDEPIADPVCMPVYFVSKLASDNGVKVCQVGEGADELFYGYQAWGRWLNLQKTLNTGVGGGLGSLSFHAMRLAGMKDGRIYDALKRHSQGQPVFWSSAQGPTIAERNSLLGSRLRRIVSQDEGWSSVEPLWKRFCEKSWEPTPLNWMSFVDLSIRLPELLLMRVDKMAMGVSLEARVPFLDHKFVELAMSIPQGVKMGGRETKHVLKQSLRGLLPGEIIDRPKRGFGVPVNEWLTGQLGKEIRKELMRFCAETGIFDMKGVDKLLSSKSRVRVWYLYNFALWHKHNIEGRSIY
jgi:asparagine synthase (glutamine-hydrolysing)